MTLCQLEKTKKHTHGDHSITVILARSALTKTHTKADADPEDKTPLKLHTIAYPRVKWFKMYRRAAQTLPELLTLLRRVESEPRAAIIRAEILPEHEGEPRDRKKRSDHFRRDGSEADNKRVWVCLDIDDPGQIEPGTPEHVILCEPMQQTDRTQQDISDYTRHVIDMANLPREFKRASCIVQFSASQLPDFTRPKMHLWFMLDAAMDGNLIKSYVKIKNKRLKHKIKVDTCTCSSVHIHYTAKPIFKEGIKHLDPFREKTRFYLVPNARGEDDCRVDTTKLREHANTSAYKAATKPPSGITEKTSIAVKEGLPILGAVPFGEASEQRRQEYMQAQAERLTSERVYACNYHNAARHTNLHELGFIFGMWDHDFGFNRETYTEILSDFVHATFCPRTEADRIQDEIQRCLDESVEAGKDQSKSEAKNI